jgi:hypothetical protein
VLFDQPPLLGAARGALEERVLDHLQPELLADDHEHGDRERLGEPLQIDALKPASAMPWSRTARMCA